jgi:nucleotide-binding universal stress UspA family protein
MTSRGEHAPGGGFANIPRRILCPTDFSEGADRALVQARKWARETGAELHVLHVIVDPPGGDAEAPAYGSMIEAREALERLIERHGIAREASRGVARGCSVVEAILDHVATEGIDLLVMGTHGRRGFRSLLIGSKTEALVRSARCPVLAVPDRMAAPSLPKRILVPLDFGPRAVGALRYAKEIAGATGGSLVLLHVIEDAVVPDFYYSIGRAIFLREPEARRLSTAGLQRLYWEAGGPDVPFDIRVVDGRAAADIGRIASEICADAIVMPTHGLAEPDRLTLGSTTDKVLRFAPCPVLVHGGLLAQGSESPRSDTNSREAAPTR